MKIVIRWFFPSVWAGCQAKKKMFIIVIIIMIILRYHFIEPRLALPLPVYLRANLISLTLPRECRDLDVHHHAWFCACAMLRIDPWLHAYWVSMLPATSWITKPLLYFCAFFYKLPSHYSQLFSHNRKADVTATPTPMMYHILGAGEACPQPYILSLPGQKKCT